MAARFLSPSPDRVMRTFCEGTLADYLSREAIDDIYKAYYFAEKSHRGQIRRSGENYIHHPIAVARALANLKMDSHTIIAALLHDVVEDTPVSSLDIQDKFGNEVAALVDGVTKISQIDFDTKEQAEAENFRKMLMAMSNDVRVMIIKLADRLHNMQTLAVMNADKQQRIARQTLETYAPIAQRLGLYDWAKELQDLCFKYLYPKRYKAIRKAISKREGNRKKIVEKLYSSLEHTLKKSAISDFDIKGRRKSVYSIYKKMVTKRLSFKELQDIYGFRIIVNSVEDCYRVLGVIHTAYKPISGRFVDYIAIPKDNGYQSLHTVVFGPLQDNVEVQIRTKEMDQIAEAGVAAHWVYKSDDSEIKSTSPLAHQWLLDLLDPQHQTSNSVEFLEHLKTDLYPDEVYVFTPKGDIKKLPKGATALDFAYAVHTDVGEHCKSVKINKSAATLSTVLKNGYSIEVVTSKRARPITTWLNYTSTARARTSIQNYLKGQTREDAYKLGKRLLNGTMKQYVFGRARVSETVQNELLAKLNIEDWRELLIEIGLGTRLPDIVARQISKLSEGSKDNDIGLSKVIGEQVLMIQGSEGLLVTYSRCCCPIPGDPIIGIFTAGHGLVIHTSDCPNITELRKQPDKCLTVDWDESLEQDFVAKLQVKLKDSKGAFALVATAIAEQSSNINHVNVNDNSDAVARVDFLIEVKNRVHLAQVIKAIRKQKGVIKVSRHKG